MKEKNQFWRSADLWYSIALLGCAILYLSGYSRLIDLDSVDGAYFVTGGGGAARLDPAWSPFYVFAYRAIRWGIPDLIDSAYCLSVGLVTALAFLTYATARRLAVKPFWSLLAAFVTLISARQLETNLVTNFDTAAFLLLFVGMSFVRLPFVRAAAMALASLLLVYVRTDNWVVGLGFLAYSGWLILTNPQSSPRRWKRAAYVGGAFAALYAAIVLLASPFPHARSWAAFSDHFFWRGCFRTNQVCIEPLYVRSYFGQSHTVADAVQNNPRAIAEHMGRNILDMPKSFWTSASAHFPLFQASSGLRWRASDLETRLLLALLAACLAMTGSLRWALGKIPRDPVQRLRWTSRFARRSELEPFWWILVAGIFAKTLLLTSLLSPAPKYFVELVLLAYVAIAWALDRWEPNVPRAATLALPALLLLVCPRVTSAVGPGHRQPIKELVLSLRKFPGLATRKIYTEAFAHLYVLPEPRMIRGYDLGPYLFENPGSSFEGFLNTENPDAVVLTDAGGTVRNLLQTHRLTDLRSPEAILSGQGFAPVLHVPNYTMWVRNDVILP